LTLFPQEAAPWGFLLLAALLTWVLLALLLPVLRRRLLDQPNARSSHRRPTPRGGGVVFVLVGTVLAPICGWGPASWLPFLCLPLALVGLVDDLRDLPAGIRYAVQFLTAVVLLLVIPSTPLPWWLMPLGLVAITAVINFVNFMDGLDGLVASCMIVLVAAASLGPGPAAGAALAPMVGALAGFLLWNWSPAQVFMGDVGSTFLGALFAGLVLLQPDPVRAVGLLLAAFPLLGDAFFCVLRRLAAGERVFQAHRLHLYQRLQQAGWSHAHVTLLYAGATAVLALGWLLASPWSQALLVGIAAAAGLGLDRRVAVPFSRALALSRASSFP
jgi:UDP-N-acetylmuramyl pentapeptide phosphotransferase/UDP-N-acetylglucosamine-1-phosphate transferase